MEIHKIYLRFLDCSGPQKSHIFFHKHSFWKSQNLIYSSTSSPQKSHMTQCRRKYVFLWHLIWDMSHQYIYTQYVSHFHYSPKLSYEIFWHVLWGWLLPIWHFVALSNFCGTFYEHLWLHIWDFWNPKCYMRNHTRLYDFFWFSIWDKNDRYRGSLFAYVAQSRPSIWSKVHMVCPFIFSATKSHIWPTKTHICCYKISFFGPKMGCTL